MSYLILLPCIFAVYFYAKTKDLSGSYFATIAVLFTVILSHTGGLPAGVDTLVAMCLTMGILNLAIWYVDKQLTDAIKAGLVELPDPVPANIFCTTRTHDFAVTPAEFGFYVELINNGQWRQLKKLLESLSAAERQGMYANIDYSSISPAAMAEFLVRHPKDVDANILFGHLKICEAKKTGLVPGVLPSEAAATALAAAFKHFRIALRINANDTEALCGLIIAKGCIALQDEQIEASLVALLNEDSQHLHGMVAAARFLIKSPEKANHFVELVEQVTECDAMVAIAKVVAHIECGGSGATEESDARVVADLYKQSTNYRQAQQHLGKWQKALSNNIIAYAFERVGEMEEARRGLLELDGRISPYPWRRAEQTGDVFAMLAF